jgi:methanethiol S-methyltransferase
VNRTADRDLLLLRSALDNWLTTSSLSIIAKVVHRTPSRSSRAAVFKVCDQRRHTCVTMRSAPNFSMARTGMAAATATFVFASLHSLLASARAKDAVGALLGPKRRDLYFRAVYNALAVGATAYLVTRLRRLPDGVVYEVRGSAALIMRALQAVSLIALADCLRSVGVLNFLGIRQLGGTVSSRNVGPQRVEAQGPALDREGRVIITGPFRLHRHPANFWPAAILWFQPRMTHVGAAFTTACTLYMIAGSYHQDIRLRRAYGREYARYRAAGVPLFIPRLPRSNSSDSETAGC